MREAASAPHGKSAVYPGTCAELSNSERAARAQVKEPALRLRVGQGDLQFTDGILGQQQQNLVKEVGDFVIKRADHLFAYQFAVVVDDLEQGITHVVRGADLVDSTARQLYLAKLLQPERSAIHYWHVPLMTDAKGQRMAKRDGSESAQAWQQHASSAELVGRFASDLGLIDKQQVLSAQELLAQISLQQLQTVLASHS